MQEIFSRTSFPISPGGNIYHWQEVDTEFQVPSNGKYVIGITASAKNAKQNNSTDDDDLRLILNGHEFGKFELHDEKISWKGFGTASSWDGASLKGSTKIIYFFVELNKGQHKLQFYADETPILKKIKVWQLKEGELFDLNDIQPKESIDIDEKGIPWLGFVFLGVKPKDFKISATCKTATKDNSDGNNVKVVANGRILKNEQAPTSRKYKNFYFSGDLDKGDKKNLELSPNKFLNVENSVELWYDQSPKIGISFKLFEKDNEYLEALEEFDDKKDSIRNKLRFVAWLSKTLKPHLDNTRLFLLHSLNDNPTDLEFDEGSSLVKKIKADHFAYNKIKEMIKERIKQGETKGNIEVGARVAFGTGDLFASIHGIKKIDFVAKKISNEKFEVEMILFDIYDFEYKSYLDAYTDNGTYKFKTVAENLIFTYLNNLADKGEYYGTVKNFNIRVKINDFIKSK